MPNMHLDHAPDSNDEDGFYDERPRPKKAKKKPQKARKISGSVLLEAILADDDESATDAKCACPPGLEALPGRHPVKFWSTGWLFKEIADTTWQLVTSKASHIFPATLREDHRGHPGYVLREIGNYAVELCPLTTRRQNAPHIPAGTTLEATGRRWDRDSYLVEAASSSLSRRKGVFDKLPEYLGILPLSRFAR